VNAYRDDLEAARGRVEDLERQCEEMRARVGRYERAFASPRVREPIAAATNERDELELVLARADALEDELDNLRQRLSVHEDEPANESAEAAANRRRLEAAIAREAEEAARRSAANATEEHFRSLGHGYAQPDIFKGIQLIIFFLLCAAVVAFVLGMSRGHAG
jgi:chromosome segregation ATPase